MLRSARRLAGLAAIPLASGELVFSMVVLASSAVLLVEDEIPPLIIYLLELYLSV